MSDVSPIVFYLLAAAVLVPAVMVVVSENLFHSGIALVTCFLGVAGVYVTLSAPFVAGMQVLVYAGAIAVILLFAFMLTHNLMHPDAGSLTFQQGPAAAICLLVGCALLLIIENSTFANNPVSAEAIRQATSIAGLGAQYLTDNLLAFELISLLLLVTLVGAVVIARKEEGEPE